MFWQQVVNAIWLGAVYSLFALGYTLVFSVLGILNLAYPSLYMWGAFAGLVAVNVFKLPIWLACRSPCCSADCWASCWTGWLSAHYVNATRQS